ncbi:MAG: DUF4864 domain-containing protein [Gemmobacter sp.]|nr:DUF4864 domain-containing protein [Gemmobacter sp.]
MRAFVVAGVVLWAGVAMAQETEIRGVIESQITAFQADDFAAAFTHASPGIKGMFGSAERFGAMVRQGYPMVHRPDEVRYLGLRTESGRQVQRVMIRDAQGRVHFLDYEMIEADGGWQINGVRLLPPQGAGA